MALHIKVVLFEDTPETQQVILAALTEHLQDDGRVIPFDAEFFEESEDDRGRMYEDRIESILGKEPFDGATLLLADRDLSKSVTSRFTGLSVNAVSAVAGRLGIPICSYAREPEPEHEYGWRRRWEEGHIVLTLTRGEHDLARRAVLVARGFATIAEALRPALKEEGNDSPAKVMAALLDKSEYADKIALYGVGDQNRIADLPAEPNQNVTQLRRLTRFLGYWLWDSLLRYPGLLVNEVAAASYLNLAAEDFRPPEVRALFGRGLYCGPFEDSERPQWWRGELDDIMAEENSDGLALVRAKVNGEARPSTCYVDPQQQAGYYCVIARKPVSLENSKGGLSWFPRGADLTRVGNLKFEEYGPWIGS